MAARKKNWIDEKTRDKIKTTQIINRLQKFALGEMEPNGSKPIEMNANQVRAAVALVNKKLPDLTSADISMTQDIPESQQEIFDNLVDKVGIDIARQLAPGFEGNKVEH